MRPRLSLYICLFALLLPSYALADSLFSLSGDLTNGGTFNGTLSVSALGEAYVQGTYRNGSYAFTLPVNYLGEQLQENGYVLVDAFPVPAPQFDLLLYVPVPTLAGYTGGSLCAIYNNVCALSEYSSYAASFPSTTYFLHLTATPADTPERSTLLLLGTGILAAVGSARRRLGA